MLAMFFLFKDVKYSELNTNFVFNWNIFFLTFFLFFIIKLVNTYRFSLVYKILLSNKLFLILCHSNMMLNIFPFRLGELSYISELQKITNKKYSEIASRLLKIRLFDYVSIYVLLIISSIYVYNEFSDIIKIISIFFIVSLVFFLFVIIFIIKFNLSKRIKIKKISKLIETIEREINSNSCINSLRDLKVLILSLFYWTLRLLMGYFILKILGIDLSFFTLSFISLAVFFLGLIPVQFFAGFGIFEAGFLFFLTKLGFEYDSTLIIIFSYHIYLLIPTIIFGVAGWIGSLKFFK